VHKGLCEAGSLRPSVVKLTIPAKEVNYYLLVCEGTIEETEVVRLRGKEVQQHRLLGDHIPWPSSLDEALKELGGHA